MSPFTLNALVERKKEQTPTSVAVHHKTEEVTYAELDAMAERFKKILWAMQVRPADRVAIYQPKSIRGVAALLGILKCGAAYVPIDPGAPAERARYIINHCGISVLIGAGRPLRQLAKSEQRVCRRILTTDGTPIVNEISDEVQSFDEAIELNAEAPKVKQTNQDLAYVLYTSGSTGTPKGVAITHGQSLIFVESASATFELTGEDIVASHAPFNFDLSVIDLFCSFCAGASVAIIPETWLGFPTKIGQMIEETPITVWNSVPSALVQLTKHGSLEKRNLDRLRLIMFAGEPYPLKHLRELKKLSPKSTLMNVYGQTEANSSTFYFIDEIPPGEAPLPIGKPFYNYDVLVLDDDGSQVRTPGLEGELFVIGGAVASGYWNDPERTAEAFVQHPLRPQARQVVYRTKDRVCFDDDGNLIFKGRTDFAIKCRGFRVELGEIESVACSHEEVEQAIATGVPDDEVGNLLVLFVTSSGADEKSIRELMSKALPKYMMPEKLVIKESLPQTNTGKADRRALAEEAKTILGRG